MRRKGDLTLAQARAIKDMLWEGKEQVRIAAVVGVSQPTISRIRHGSLHGNTPWPDGSLGALPSISTLNPHGADGEEWSAEAQRLLTMTEDMQARVLEIVNTQRARTDLPIIPPMAEAYEEYLASMASEDEDEDVGFEGLLIARQDENKRLTMIMDEFNALIDGELSKGRDADLMNAITTTKAVNTNTPPSPYKGPPRYVVLPWSSIISKDPTNPLIREAVASSDSVRIEAICIVFKQVAQTRDSWRSEGVARLVHETEERLYTYPDLIKQIKEASKIGTTDGDSRD